LKKNDLVEMPENYNHISKEKNSELSNEQDFEVGKSCNAGKYYNHKITKFRLAELKHGSLDSESDYCVKMDGPKVNIICLV
jgi:hypothetical protein